MKKAKAKYMSPFRANSEKKVCTLNRDNISIKNGWILVDGYDVSIGQQAEGEGGAIIVRLSRVEFAKLARWFFTEQKLRSRDNGNGNGR